MIADMIQPDTGPTPAFLIQSWKERAAGTSPLKEGKVTLSAHAPSRIRNIQI